MIFFYVMLILYRFSAVLITKQKVKNIEKTHLPLFHRCEFKEILFRNKYKSYEKKLMFSYCCIYQIRFCGKMQYNEWFCRWYNDITYSLRNINIFRSHFAPTTDRYHIETQIIITRTYLVLLVVSLLIFVTYTSQVYVTETVSVKYPTYDQFLSLYRIYPESLSCPCTVISIVFDQFMYLDVSYHQVCDSIYTSFAWRHLIDSTTNGS